MKTSIALCSFILFILVFTGCNAGSKPIVVTLSPGPAQSAMAGQTVSITAAMAHDSKQQGVTWSLAGTGALSGQSATSVTYVAPSLISANTTATVTATSITDKTKTATLTINLQAVSISLSPTSPATVEAKIGIGVAATVSNDPDNKGVTWTLSPSTGAGTLSGQTTTAVTYTAPSAVPGTPTATITATSVFDTSKTASVMINLVAHIALVTTSLPTGTVGAAYSTTLVASGGVTPYSWSWSAQSGSQLPPGLSLSTAGAITGTPTAGGSYNVTIKVGDSATPTNSWQTGSFTIAINVSPLSITTASLPNGQVGVNYGTGGNGFTIFATGGIAPYTFQMAANTGSQLPLGLSLSSSGIISGMPTDAGNWTNNLTIQVIDSATPTNTATKTFSLVITAGVASISPATGNLHAATVGQPYSQTISASGGLPPYVQWSFSGLPAWLTSSAPSGSNNQTVTLTGTPSPGDLGTTTGINVTLQDSESPAVQAAATYSLTVDTVAACITRGSESMLNGRYAFVLTGFDDGTQPALVGGVLTFNGSGTITAGALDMNLNSGVQTNLALTSGSYGVSSDQRGCMAITTSAGTQNYRFSLGNLNGGVASTAHVVDFDTTGPYVVGTMRQQTNSAFGTGTGQITGNYAFGFSSGQSSNLCIVINGASVCGGKFGAVGVFDFSGGSIAGGEIDMNLNGEADGQPAATNWPSSPATIDGGGTYSVSSSTGRGTFSFTPNGSGALNGILYVVSSSEVLALSSDRTGVIWAGEMMQQSGAPFSSANPLSGSYVGYNAGLGNGGTGRTDIILFGPFSSGHNSLSFTQLRNDSGTFTSQTVSSGATYSVTTSNGRTSVTAPGSNHLPVLYLVSTSAAFYLNSDAGVDSGYIQSQTSTSNPAGTYAFGNNTPQTSADSVTTGLAAFASSDIGLTQDQNSNGTLTPDATQTLTYSTDSTGLGYIPSGCNISASSTTCQTLFYIISPTKAVVMDTTSANPKLTTADK